MRGHVDAESLALYAEGQLSRGRTARVRAHLSGCPDCAATLAALTEVTTELSHVPAPPMPAAVAARLDAALSAESARRAAAPAPASASAGAPEPRPPRRGPLWSPTALRILAATGVTLVVAGGVGYAVSQFSGTPAGTATPASAPAHRSPIEGAPNISPGGGHMVRPNTPTPSRPAYARTGTDYQRGTLARQARRSLAEYTVSGMSGPGLIKPANVPAQVHRCVNQIARGHSLRLVDLARYQHLPAIVIVLGKPDSVIAVSYSCARLHSAPLTVRG